MSTERMSGKERIMAAIRRQEVDRVPCVPLVVPYTAGEFRDDMPHYMPDVMRAAELDIWKQGVVDYKCAVVPKRDSGILPIRKFRNGNLITGYETPVGTITQEYHSGIKNSLMPHVKHLLQTPEDLEVFYYVREHSEVQLIDMREHYDWEKKKVGEDGVFACSSGIEMSPLKNFIELIAGVEDTYYLMMDEPELFDATMDLMHCQNLEMLKKFLEASETEIILQSENTSWTTESPEMYRKYHLNQLNDYSRMIHEYGKLHAVHMCGKLQLLSDELKAGEFDLMADISPAPTGDTELWEAAEMCPDKAVKGGIECTDLISPDPQKCYDKAMLILEKTNGRRGVMLGSGDSVPCGTTLEHLRAIRRAADDFAGLR